jgi:ParB family chromosome partitioning protein
VANALRLLRLPRKIRDDVGAGILSEGHARALLGLERPADQLKARDEVVKRRLTVRATEALVRRLRAPRHGVTLPRRTADPNQGSLEERLRLALGTKVRIARQGRGGTLEIAFFSDDDLTRLVALITGEG